MNDKRKQNIVETQQNIEYGYYSPRRRSPVVPMILEMTSLQITRREVEMAKIQLSKR